MAQSVIEFRQDFTGIISSSVTSNGANFGTVVKADLILGNKMDYLVYLILSFIYRRDETPVYRKSFCSFSSFSFINIQGCRLHGWSRHALLTPTGPLTPLEHIHVDNLDLLPLLC